MIAAAVELTSLGATVIAVLTVVTLIFVVRDRRYRTAHDLFEVERQRNEVLAVQLAECKARNATLEARPDLEQHAVLLERLFRMIEVHEQEATTRAVKHEERAQARADATVNVLRQISTKLERGDEP